MSIPTAGTFADYFPEGCPPEQAGPTSGTFFRLVRSDPPGEDEFRTHREKGYNRGGDPCQKCGLSIYGEQTDAADLYRFFARRHGVHGTRIGNLVAKLSLNPSHGKLMPTPRQRRPDSHHTWWPFCETDRVSSFVEIVEDARDGLDS
jgi:hypothetical protein